MAVSFECLDDFVFSTTSLLRVFVRALEHSAVPTALQIKTIALQSSRVDMRAQLAGAYIEQDALILFPIDEVKSARWGPVAL